MAQVTSYSTLATALDAYLKRSGFAASYLDYLIQEVEQELDARLRVRRMLTSLTPTVSSAGVVTLPSDFGGWKRFQVRDGVSEWDLDLKDAELTTEIMSAYTSSGRPEALLTGATCQIWPYTDGVYTFVAKYFALLANLTSGAPTNWVITNSPMTYLYGCLAAARGFVSDDKPVGASRFEMWAKRFDRSVEQINDVAAKELDARTHATLVPDSSMFGQVPRSHIESDQ